MKLKPRDAAAVSIGIELVVSVMLGLGGGYWLDKKLHTSPWFTLFGIVLGFAAGLRSLIGMMRRASREDGGSPPPGGSSPPPPASSDADGGSPDERKP